MSNMTFNVAEGLLYGELSGVKFRGAAVSGGRGGSTDSQAGNWLLQNNVFSSRIKESPTRMGGTIPLGKYFMVPHEKKERWTRLNPCKGTYLADRDGFAIHPRGPEGSHGCIVPFNDGEAQRIRAAVQIFRNNNNEWPIIEIIAVGDIDFKANMV